MVMINILDHTGRSIKLEQQRYWRDKREASMSPALLRPMRTLLPTIFFKATAILSLCVQRWRESPSCLAQTRGDFQDVDLPGFLSGQTGTSWSPSSWGLASSHKTINKQQILKRAVLCTVCLPCPTGLMSMTSCYKDPTPRKKSCSHFTDRKTENLSEIQHLYTAEVHILNHITHFYPTTRRRKPS